MLHGEEGKGNNQRGGDILDGDIGRAGKDFVAGNQFGMAKVDGKMGVAVVAGGILAPIEIHNRVGYFLDTGTMEKAIALLGDDTRDDAFLGDIVKGNRIGHVLGIAFFEVGDADRFAGRV